jgi:hypothetical protein
MSLTKTRTRQCRHASGCLRNWRNRLPLRVGFICGLPHLVALFQEQMVRGPGRQLVTRQAHEAHKDDQRSLSINISSSKVPGWTPSLLLWRISESVPIKERNDQRRVLRSGSSQSRASRYDDGPIHHVPPYFSHRDMVFHIIAHVPMLYVILIAVPLSPLIDLEDDCSTSPIRTNLSKDEAKRSSICDDIKKKKILIPEGAVPWKMYHRSSTR